MPQLPAAIEHLSFRDFRGLEEVVLQLPEEPITVLVGTNGSGKSSILEGTAILLSRLAGRIRSERGGGRQLQDEDVRNEASDTEIGIRLRLNGTEAAWTIVKTRRGRVAREHSELDQIRHLAGPIRESLRADAEDGRSGSLGLPVLVYYPTNRAVLDIPVRIRIKHSFEQVDTYEEALLTGANIRFRHFFEWFRDREDYENEQLRDDSAYQDPKLDAVREAVALFLPGFDNLRVRRGPNRMTVTQDGREVTVNQLSDGEKCLLALVGDLARRLAIANPHGNPLHGAGIVLIDEIELHLHPRWQHHVMENLTRTFPKCQFILSTHSPAVLGHAVNRTAILLQRKDGRIEAQPIEPYGKDANVLLEDVFSSPSRPGKIAEDLDELFRLIDDDKTEEARKLLNALRDRIGNDEPEFARAELLLWEPAS